MIVFSAIVGQIGDHFSVWQESQAEYDNEQELLDFFKFYERYNYGE